MFSPTVASSRSSNKPSEFSSKPSSSLEQSMPLDSIPRIFAFLILKGFASSDSMITAPSLAKGTFKPARTFGAPHTTCTDSSPSETEHRLNLSALGCGSTDSTRPTIIPLH